MRGKRRVIALLMLLGLLLPGLLAGCTGQGSENKVLRVGTNPEFPPFEYIDNEGNVAGFDADLIEAIAENQGYTIAWSSMEFKSLIGALESGGVDVVIAGMTITEARRQSVDFTDAYYDASQMIIVQTGSPIRKIEELNGKQIAVQEGTTGDLMVTPGGEGSILTDSSTKTSRYKKGVDAILEIGRAHV